MPKSFLSIFSVIMLVNLLTVGLTDTVMPESISYL